MTKDEILKQLKGLKEDAEYNRTCIMQDNPQFYLEDSFEMWDNDVKALETAIKAVEAFDYDDREEITVTLKARKSPEGDDTYYCDLETGERLVIRGGELEGIYNPNSEDENSEYEKTEGKNFLNAVFGISCNECPCCEFCRKCSTVGCAETVIKWLETFHK